MKRNSTWLAAGLVLFAVLACNLSKNSNYNSNNNNSKNSNTNKNTSAPKVNRAADAEIYVSKLNMAKDDNGKAGEATDTFAPDDHTVYAKVTLNKAKSGTQVRFVWVAADVDGDTNKELKSLDYTTKAFENLVNGHLTWPIDWPKGKYRVEVYINGALDKTADYTVE